MRKVGLLVLTAALIAACDTPTTPVETDSDLSLMAEVSASVSTAGPRETGMLRRLPDGLKLTAEQDAQIRGLIEAFEAATKADRQALAVLMQQLREIGRDRNAREEIERIRNEAEPIVERLRASEANLKAAIDAVLTAEQKAWLDANRPERRDCRNVPRLTDAQREQIRVLVATFENANKADLQLVNAVHRRAAEARRAGKSREEVAAILAEARAAVERLAAARSQLRDDIRAVLTPEQRESGCYA